VSDADNGFVGPPDPPYVEIPVGDPRDPQRFHAPVDPPYVDGDTADGGDGEGHASKTELHRMTKDELADYAAARGLSTDGTKDEIHQRVVDAGFVA
jgi:hypothetical protein